MTPEEAWPEVKALLLKKLETEKKTGIKHTKLVKDFGLSLEDMSALAICLMDDEELIVENYMGDLNAWHRPK